MSIKTGYIRKIEEYFSMLTNKIEVANMFNRLEVDIVVEPLICGILNHLFGWKLRMMNDSMEADLLDSEQRIAVSLTSTNSIIKIRNILRVAHEYNAWERFDRLIVFVISNRAVSSRIRAIDDGDRFKGERDIWSIPDLKRMIFELNDLSLLKEITLFLEESLGDDLPQYLPPAPPKSVMPFVGREVEILDLAQLLTTEDQVFVSGLGGIGKTQLVLRFAEEYREKYRPWFIRYQLSPDHSQESMRYTILNINFGGYQFSGHDSDDREREYRERMEILRKLPDTSLLIIDGFDCPDRMFTQLCSECSYHELVSLGHKMVFTTRYPVESNGIRLGAIPDQKLIDLMRFHCGDADTDEGDLLQLIHAVHGHTLTVELMAKTLEDSWGGIAPADILAALQRSDLKRVDFPEVDTSYGGHHVQAQIYEHLRALFNLKGLDQAEIAVMRCATLLPESGMDALLFRDCLHPEEQRALISLVKQGWLARKNNILTIHPVVRQICREELKPDDENCGAFLNLLSNGFDFKSFYDAKCFLDMAQCLSIAAQNLEDRNGNWAAAAAFLWNKLGRLKDACVYEKKAVDARELETSCNVLDLAQSYNNLGSVLYALESYCEALEYQERALKIWERVLPAEHSDLAASYNNVGTTCMSLGYQEKGLEYHLKALAIRENNLSAEHPNLAMSYSNVGSVYRSLGDYSKALEYHEKALRIREAILPADHPDVAQSLNNLGNTYSEMDQPESALFYLEKTLSIRQRILPPGHPSLATSYENVGNCYSSLGDYGKALQYLRKSLQIRETYLPADHPDIAASYDSLGNTYDAEGEYREALVCRLKAMECLERNQNMDPIMLAESYDNVSMSYSILNDCQNALEYQLKAVQIWKDTMPADHPGFAALFNNLAFSYYSCGDTRNALRYMEEALEISRQTLPAEDPKLDAIQKNLDYLSREIVSM